MKQIFPLIILIFSVTFLSSCKKDEATAPIIIKNSSVSGVVKFWDGTPGYYARIELKNLSNNNVTYDTCDSKGNFSFTELAKGNYTLTYRSATYEVNTTYVSVTLGEYDQVTKDVYITYHIFDEYGSRVVNKDVCFLKLQIDGAKLGGHYEIIDHLSGYYRRDDEKSATLSFELYKIPDDFDWQNPKLEITADSIRHSFEYLTSIVEDTVMFNNHQVRIQEEKIPLIFSNPKNGFALIKIGEEDKELKIPCVDYVNNDYGFVIYYK